MDLRGQNQDTGRAEFFLEALGEKAVPSLFHFLEAICILWLGASSFIFKVSSITSNFPDSHASLL